MAMDELEWRTFTHTPENTPEILEDIQWQDFLRDPGNALSELEKSEWLELFPHETPPSQSENAGIKMYDTEIIAELKKLAAWMAQGYITEEEALKNESKSVKAIASVPDIEAHTKGQESTEDLIESLNTSSLPFDAETPSGGQENEDEPPSVQYRVTDTAINWLERIKRGIMSQVRDFVIRFLE